MSIRVDTSSLIPGAIVVGNRGLGVLGSVVPSTGTNGAGYLYNDLALPADADKEVRGLIVTPPSAGTFFAYEDSSFSLTGAPDGTYSFVYRLFVDGADLGTATAEITIGESSVTGVAAWTEQDDTVSITANLLVAGVASWVEEDDSASISATLTVSGAASWTEENDIAQIVGNLLVSGVASWTEENDTVSITASIEGAVIYTSAPAGSGYSPKNKTVQTRPPAIQTNYR